MYHSETVAMPEWLGLTPERLTGTILTIGATDTGKSTLVGWLARHLAAAAVKVAWIDADVGQSTLGLPATMSLAMPTPAEVPPPVATFFLGATSPRGHLLPALAGLFRLRERALAAGATAVLVDSSGFLTATAGGGALKEWEIELLRPATVIAVQEERELEHILGPLRRRRDLRLHLLPVSAHVRRRSPEARRARRRRQFSAYFAAASPLRLAVRHLPIYGLEKAAPGRLLGLLDGDGFALAIGILRQHRHGAMEILTPLREGGRVAAVRLGDLRIAPETGEELG